MPTAWASAAEAIRRVAEGDEVGAELALLVVEDVLALEPLIALAKEAAQGGALRLMRALRVCEKVIEAMGPVMADVAVDDGDDAASLLAVAPGGAQSDR